MDLRHLLKIIDSRIATNPNSTSRSLAQELDVTVRSIERAIREIDGVSFNEYLENRRLARVLKIIEEKRWASAIDDHAPPRAEPRKTIPGAIVSYHLHGRGNRGSSSSASYPLFDLCSGGMAFFSDRLLKPGRKVLLSIKCEERNVPLTLQCHVVYAMATDMPGYRYRIGVRFMPFEARKGCNPPETLNSLVRLIREATSYDAGPHI